MWLFPFHIGPLVTWYFFSLRDFKILMKVIDIQRMTQFTILTMFTESSYLHNYFQNFFYLSENLLVGFQKGSCSCTEGFWSKNRSIESNKLWNLFGNIFNEGKLTEADPKGFWLIQTEKQQDNFISIYHCLSQSVPQKKGALNPSDLRCTVSTLHKQILNSPQRDGSACFTCRKG